MDWQAIITEHGPLVWKTAYRLLGNEGSDHAYSDIGIRLPERPKKSAYLKLMNVSPDVRNVLRIAGFEDYLEIYNNQEEALAAF